jgi:hypothetical protein
MKSVIALAASLLVNSSLLIAFERSADEARPLPSGEVFITDLSVEAVPSLAQVSAVSSAERPVAL